MGVNVPAYAFFGVEVKQKQGVDYLLHEMIEHDCEDEFKVDLPEGVGYLHDDAPYGGKERMFLTAWDGGGEVDAKSGPVLADIKPVDDEDAIAAKIKSFCEEHDLIMTGEPRWLLFTYYC